MSAVNDELLVQRAKQGDPEAFSELVSLYEKKVYNLAYRLTGNHQDAEDMYQEAFLRVYRMLPDFRGDASFSTWLYRIVSNTCVDELRRRKRQRTVSINAAVETNDGEMERELPSDEDTPEDQLQRVEVRHLVQYGLEGLDEEFRLVLVLRYVNELSYNQIAEATGLPLGTVKSRLNRALKALKEKLSDLELLPSGVVYTPRRGKLHELR